MIKYSVYPNSGNLEATYNILQATSTNLKTSESNLNVRRPPGDHEATFSNHQAPSMQPPCTLYAEHGLRLQLQTPPFCHSGCMLVG